MSLNATENEPLLARKNEEEQGEQQHATRKISRWITVEPIMVLYFMAFAPSVPLYEQFVYQQISERLNFSLPKNDSSTCFLDTNSTQYKEEEEVQSQATRWLTYFLIVSIVPMTIMMPFIGPYTDERGRKIAMYLPLLGAVGKLTVGTVVVAFHWPFEVLILGSLIDGFSGGIVAIMMAAFAYIADITSVQQRAKRIFLLEVAIGIGIITSDVGMGYAIKLLGYFYPFLMLTAMHFLNILYTFFGVQESIIKRDNVKFFAIIHIKKMWKVIAVDNENKRRWKLQMCLAMLFLINGIDTGNSDIQTYKLLKTPLCFTSVLIGYFVSMSYAVKFVLGAAILKLGYPYLGEIWMVVLSALSATTFNFIFPFATSREFAFLSVFALCAAFMATPMTRAYTSKLMNPREQGTLMAIIAWIQSAAAMVGNVTLNSVYSATVGFHSGLLAFITAAGFYITAAILALVLIVGTRRENSSREASKLVEPERNV